MAAAHRDKEAALDKAIIIEEVRGGTAQETAYLTLRRAAMVGAFSAGSAITIRGVAQTLHMSPTPVREALRRLCAERALAVLENRRIAVPALSPARLEELIELRITLETHAAERAFPFVSGKKVEELTSIDERANNAIAHEDYEAAVIENQRFHVSLYESNPEQQIVPMVESVWMQLGPYLRHAATQAATLANDRHHEILSALTARSLPALTRAIELDIREGIYSCRAIMESERRS